MCLAKLNRLSSSVLLSHLYPALNLDIIIQVQGQSILTRVDVDCDIVFLGTSEKINWSLAMCSGSLHLHFSSNIFRATPPYLQLHFTPSCKILQVLCKHKTLIGPKALSPSLSVINVHVIVQFTSIMHAGSCTHTCNHLTLLHCNISCAASHWLGCSCPSLFLCPYIYK